MPVEIGQERLRLNIIAIDHAIIRSIMRGSILNFLTRQILDILTDRTTKVATKLSAFTKSLHFQSIVVGADFERQERQESFRAWTASKGMFTDSYSYWQRTTDGGWAASKLQRACARTILRTDNVRPIRGRSDFETWTDQTTKPRKPRNHESVLKKHFDKKC